VSCDNCEEALDNLYLFLDEEIDTASIDEIQAHIDNCSSCLNVYDLERVVKALVSRSCAEKAPEPLRAKVLYSIRSVHIQVSEKGPTT
jgi:mycothiol system anti-sigma-R factor